MKYNRILLKLSGESLMGEREYGIDAQATKQLANKIKTIYNNKKELVIVIGGGNIFRGKSAAKNGMDRATADYMGMLATVINSLALQDEIEKIGIETRVLSAISMPSIAEPYIRRRALRHIEKGRIIILAAGTGHPYFSTDSNAVLRALELHCDIVFKATTVDGVYSNDPKIDATAQKYDSISFQEVIEKNLEVMDGSAFALARENNLPIYIFNQEDLEKVIAQDTSGIGTIVN